MNKTFFLTQRQLRQKRLNALKKGILGLIDLGSSKITCFLLNFSVDENEQKFSTSNLIPKNIPFRVIGVATTKSRGISNGEIISIEEVEKAIRTVVQASQKMAGVIIEDVMVSFSGGNINSTSLIGKAEIESSVVNEKDIGNALGNCNFNQFISNHLHTKTYLFWKNQIIPYHCNSFFIVQK